MFYYYYCYYCYYYFNLVDAAQPCRPLPPSLLPPFFGLPSISHVLQDPIKGGFGGGPKQLPHCAPMYASVLSLLIIGTPEAYSIINRWAIIRGIVWFAEQLDMVYCSPLCGSRFLHTAVMHVLFGTCCVSHIVFFLGIFCDHGLGFQEMSYEVM